MKRAGTSNCLFEGPLGDVWITPLISSLYYIHVWLKDLELEAKLKLNMS